MLRCLRMILALCMIAALTAFFLDFSETIPSSVGWLAKFQLIPAVTGALSGAVASIIILAVLVVITLVAGRVYCSCICPLGIMQDIISRISQFARRKQKRTGYCYTPPQRKTRLFFFLLLLTALFLGALGMPRLTLIVGLLDPYAHYGRIAVHLFYPVYACGNNLLVACARLFDSAKFYLVPYPIQNGVAFASAFFFLIFLTYIASRFGRFYCNAICPVGTFLGFLSRKAVFRIHIDADNCIQCRQCAKKCKCGCIDIEHGMIDHDRCVCCFNCLDACKKDSIHYLPFRKKHQAKSGKTDDSNSQQVNIAKRHFLIEAFLTSFWGFFGGWVTKTLANDDVKPEKSEVPPGHSHHEGERRKTWHAVSPPGSVSLKHLASCCTLCHLCVSKCPQKVIKPALFEYGVSGLLLPVMKFSPEVFCNYDCTLCGEVCPTSAIKPLTINEKHSTQTGHVVFFKDKCVVFTDETNCGACAEHCPTQAVSMVDYKGNLTIPETHKEFCIGCGACESICPVLPVQAIRVKGHLVHRNAELPPQEKTVEAQMDDFGF